MANVLSTEKRVSIVKALSEGNSIRATSRIVGVSKNTTSKLLVELGRACSEYQDKTLRQLPCKRVEMDEIWSFVGMKAKTARRKGIGNTTKHGDIWTWVALCSDTKLAISWLVGARDYATGKRFVEDVAERLVFRIQLTTDGLKVYIEAVEEVFGADIDYATLEKQYGSQEETRRAYSPAKITGTKKTVIQGEPDLGKACTSYVERQNLSMRTNCRRLIRLTNGFSKKEENHALAISLYYMVYNFVKPHGTLTKRANGTPTTPAMALMLATRPYSYEDVVALLDSKD